MTQTRPVAKTTKSFHSGVTSTQRTAVILMAQLFAIVALLVLGSIIRRRRQVRKA